MAKIQVDQQDQWLLKEYTWSINGDGYPYTNVVVKYGGEGVRVRRRAFLHHCIMGQPIWEGDEIDHRNRKPEDARRSNLRYVSRSVNRQNTSRAPGISGERNIYEKDDGRYHVRIRRDKIEYYLGAYTTMEEAITVRDNWNGVHSQRRCCQA